MSSSSGPTIPLNGLVFHYDIANTQKSWKGKPTTNIISTPVETYTGWGGNSWWIHPGNTVTTQLTNLPNGTYGSVFCATSLNTGGLYSYYPNSRSSDLVNGTTYTLSCWVKSYNESNSSLYVRNADSGGSLTYTFPTITNTWKRMSVTFTHNGIGGMITFTGSNFMLWGVQVEISSFATPFVSGTRSISQALVDLTGNSTINIGSLTYDSDGSFKFNGTSDYLTIPFNSSKFTFNSEQTIIIWMKNSSPSTARRNPYNQAYAGAGTITHEYDTSFNYFYGTQGGNGSPYTNHTSPFNVIIGEVAMIALTRNPSQTAWYKNGILGNTSANPYGSSVVTGTSDINIGTGYTNPFGGNIYSVQLYNRALTSSEIFQLFNATKERFFGYQNITYTASGNMTLTNNGSSSVTMFKTSSNNVWDGQVYSTDSFTAPCTIEFYKQAGATDNGVSYAMIGWNVDPTADASYSSLDYASYPFQTNLYQVYHNGTLVLSSGSWDSNKKFYIVYDTDGYIRHYNGNTLIFSANWGTSKAVYVDSSFHSVNSTYGGFTDVRVCRRSWNGSIYV